MGVLGFTGELSSFQQEELLGTVHLLSLRQRALMVPLPGNLTESNVRAGLAFLKAGGILF